MFRLIKILFVFTAFIFIESWSINAQQIKCLQIIVSDNSHDFKHFNKHYTIKDTAFINKRVNEVLNTLWRKGFIAATIDSLSYYKGCNAVYITPGIKYHWSSVRFKTKNISGAGNLKLDTNKFINRELSYDHLLRKLNRLVESSENNGYPFACIYLDNISFTDSSVGAEVVLERNQIIYYDSIVNKGNLNISNTFLMNYLKMHQGDLYNEKDVSRITKRLKQLSFAELDEQMELEFNDSKLNTIIRLNKRNANRFDGIIGFMPENKDSKKLLVTGDLNLVLKNSFGNGEQLFLRWRKVKSLSQDMNIGFYYPYIFNSPFGADLQLSLLKKDTAYLNVERNIGLRVPFDGSNYVKFYYKLFTSSLISTYGMNLITNKPEFLDLKADIYGMESVFSDLDYVFNPRKGIEIGLNAAFGQKKILRNVNINELIYDSVDLKSNTLSFTSSLAFYLPLFKYNVLLLRNVSAGLFDEQIYENQLFRFGGFKLMRGFDEDELLASQYSVFTAELRYLFEKNSYLCLFSDYAYYENTISQADIIDRPVGFGVGLSFETKAGIFAFNYALGRQFNNPLDLKSAKIHFGYISTF